MTLKPGDKAPDFTLYSSDKQPVTLSDYHGSNVVLLFFPLAFSGACTTELCSMRDDIASYEGLSPQVLAVSIDSPTPSINSRKNSGSISPCFPISTRGFQYSGLNTMFSCWV